MSCKHASSGEVKHYYVNFKNHYYRLIPLLPVSLTVHYVGFPFPPALRKVQRQFLASNPKELSKSDGAMDSCQWAKSLGFSRGAPWGLISEAKRVRGLLWLLRKQEFDNLKKFSNVKCPELSKEFGDVFRIWIASKPTAAEVDVRADRRLGGILPYREKSVAREIQNMITTISTFTYYMD